MKQRFIQGIDSYKYFHQSGHVQREKKNITPYKTDKANL